jgi:putative endonuclease
VARLWFLYVLECCDGSLYTGIAVDVEKRFALHVSGKGAKYTRSHPPLKILAVQEYPDRSAASKAEHALKKLKPEQKRFFCGDHAYKKPQ